MQRWKKEGEDFFLKDNHILTFFLFFSLFLIQNERSTQFICSRRDVFTLFCSFYRTYVQIRVNSKKVEKNEKRKELGRKRLSRFFPFPFLPFCCVCLLACLPSAFFLCLAFYLLFCYPLCYLFPHFFSFLSVFVGFGCFDSSFDGGGVCLASNEIWSRNWEVIFWRLGKEKAKAKAKTGKRRQTSASRQRRALEAAAAAAVENYFWFLPKHSTHALLLLLLLPFVRDTLLLNFILSKIVVIK